jgi:2-keto-4-pentenoate hydratase/2-oxohepta-3-ene-1,7-dioic acid hydratase in catechol pathway
MTSERVCRVVQEGGARFGVIEGDPDASCMAVSLLASPPFDRIAPTGETVELHRWDLLAPVAPSKVIGFGRNYTPGLQADYRRRDEEPSMFLKPPSSVVGNGASIKIPAWVGGALYEPELAVVIGRACRDVEIGEWQSVVFGYTCANDVSAVGLPPAAGSGVAKAKSFDTFCPLGPWIQTGLDPDDLLVHAEFKGARQEARTSDLMTSVGTLVVLASSVMTLEPGDVILTGACGTFAPIEVGSTVSVTIEGIGTLANPVVAG